MTLLTAFFLWNSLPTDTVKHQSDAWLAKDKVLHFSLSFIVYSGLEEFLERSWNSRNNTTALCITVGIGITKEIYDMTVKKTFFSWKDLIADLSGVALAILFH